MSEFLGQTQKNVAPPARRLGDLMIKLRQLPDRASGGRLEAGAISGGRMAALQQVQRSQSGVSRRGDHKPSWTIFKGIGVGVCSWLSASYAKMRNVKYVPDHRAHVLRGEVKPQLFIIKNFAFIKLCHARWLGCRKV